MKEFLHGLALNEENFLDNQEDPSLRPVVESRCCGCCSHCRPISDTIVYGQIDGRQLGSKGVVYKCQYSPPLADNTWPRVKVDDCCSRFELYKEKVDYE